MTANCFAAALFLRAGDAKTLSISELFLADGNGIALFLYTLLFLAVAYTGYWIYIREQKKESKFIPNPKKKPPISRRFKG